MTRRPLVPNTLKSSALTTEPSAGDRPILERKATSTARTSGLEQTEYSTNSAHGGGV